MQRPYRRTVRPVRTGHCVGSPRVRRGGYYAPKTPKSPARERRCAALLRAGDDRPRSLPPGPCRAGDRPVSSRASRTPDTTPVANRPECQDRVSIIFWQYMHMGVMVPAHGLCDRVLKSAAMARRRAGRFVRGAAGGGAGARRSVCAGRAAPDGGDERVSEGKPVFLLHGTPGSRLGPSPRGMVLYHQGVRLISQRPAPVTAVRTGCRTAASPTWRRTWRRSRTRWVWSASAWWAAPAAGRTHSAARRCWRTG